MVQQRGDEARDRLSKRWEDQELYKGGWQLRKGKLELKSGNKLSKIALGKIFITRICRK